MLVHLNPKRAVAHLEVQISIFGGSERAPRHSAKAKRPDCPAKVDFTL
jgi:hypothetical protein